MCWIHRFCSNDGLVFFFFQAEDGIRDSSVTRVQTCALPISDRLALKHHSAVELIDRLEAHGYVRRSRSRDDRRRVLVALLPRGEKLLEQVARDRIGELRASGAALVNAISALLENGGSLAAKKKPAVGTRRPHS